MPVTNRIFGLFAMAVSALAVPALAQDKPAKPQDIVVIPLPEISAPVTTDDGRGLATIIALPEAPPTEVVIAPAELAGLSPARTDEPAIPAVSTSAQEPDTKI
jgi:hypothetical protein